jgi:hypothetical protein
MIIALWLIAIVSANLSIGYFGPEVSILNAFLLIGLTLTTRDYLHSRWDGKHLKIKMGALIATGGILSWLTQPAVGQIAMASVIAFAVSELVDSVIYHKTRSINKSNFVSALIDSVIFPTIAFGGFPVLIIIGQWLAKFGGGYIWSLVLRKRTWVVVLALIGITSTQAQVVNFDGFTTDEGEQYVTASVFAPGQVEVFAFIDRYFDGAEVVYGEGSVYFNKEDFAPTVQIEFGNAKYFSIDEVLLGGIRYKGIEFLIRSDDKVQFTYVWFYQFGNLRLNGYVDVWGFEDWQGVTQPQAWYYISDWFALGGEAFIRFDSDKITATPAAGIKISKNW